jgi:hypothetical protein
VNQVVPLIETRTAAEIDDRCGMRYWWYHEEQGTGIVPAEDPEELAVGKDIHNDAADIASIPDSDLTPDGVSERIEAIKASVNAPEHNTGVLERLYRRLGWYAAFALYLEPRLREEFETVQVEKEITLDRDTLWVPITPDRVGRHRDGKYLVYKELKSTITAGPKWTASWPFAIQIHAGIKALEEELGEKVAYGQVVGLLKGNKTGDRLSHPYVWAWRNTQSGLWTHEYAKARSAEWEHAPVWEFPGGMVSWVQTLGKEVALAQFPHSAPVFLNDKMLEDWVNRRISRQAQIEEVHAECQLSWDTRVLYFEPRTAQCRPAFGPECPYLRCCWNAEINQNPLACDQFVRRTPHHELEAIGVE